MADTLKISELFYSIQGEGKLLGVPSAFVRTSGCNLRCTWCDTPYASWDPEGEDREIEEVLAWVRSTPARHVVFTGGEPMIQPRAEALCARLSAEGYHVTVETAGTVFKPLAMDLASISPKLANSTPHQREGGRFAQLHERNRLNTGALQKLIDHAPDVQLKFVVSGEGDLEEIEALLAELRGVGPGDVLLMPEGTDVATLAGRSGWLADACLRTGYRYCPRLHVELWGNRRGV